MFKVKRLEKPDGLGKKWVVIKEFKDISPLVVRTFYHYEDASDFSVHSNKHMEVSE